MEKVFKADTTDESLLGVKSLIKLVHTNWVNVMSFGFYDSLKVTIKRLQSNKWVPIYLKL